MIHDRGVRPFIDLHPLCIDTNGSSVRIDLKQHWRHTCKSSKSQTPASTTMPICSCCSLCPSCGQAMQLFDLGSVNCDRLGGICKACKRSNSNPVMSITLKIWFEPSGKGLSTTNPPKLATIRYVFSVAPLRVTYHPDLSLIRRVFHITNRILRLPSGSGQNASTVIRLRPMQMNREVKGLVSRGVAFNFITLLGCDQSMRQNGLAFRPVNSHFSRLCCVDARNPNCMVWRQRREFASMHLWAVPSDFVMYVPPVEPSMPGLQNLHYPLIKQLRAKCVRGVKCRVDLRDLGRWVFRDKRGNYTAHEHSEVCQREWLVRNNWRKTAEKRVDGLVSEHLSLSWAEMVREYAGSGGSVVTYASSVSTRTRSKRKRRFGAL